MQEEIPFTTGSRLALQNGDVDAWTGLDPTMARAELETGARPFFRKPNSNTWGVLNVRTEFANDHPEPVARVLQAYDRARLYAIAQPEELKQAMLSRRKQLQQETTSRILPRRR